MGVFGVSGGIGRFFAVKNELVVNIVHHQKDIVFFGKFHDGLNKIFAVNLPRRVARAVD